MVVHVYIPRSFRWTKHCSGAAAAARAKSGTLRQPLRTCTSSLNAGISPHPPAKTRAPGKKADKRFPPPEDQREPEVQDGSQTNSLPCHTRVRACRIAQQEHSIPDEPHDIDVTYFPNEACDLPSSDENHRTAYISTPTYLRATARHGTARNLQIYR